MTLRAKWLLTHWKGYVLSREFLLEKEERQASIFFNALKEMNKEDVAFLASKYYDTDRGTQATEVTTGLFKKYRPISDSEMAKRLGMDEKAYTRKRVAIERRLNAYIQVAKEVVQEKKINNADYFVLKVGNLYLKSYRLKKFNRIEPSFVVTTNGKEAFLFGHDSLIAKELIRVCNFTKEVIKSDYPSVEIYVNENLM